MLATSALGSPGVCAYRWDEAAGAFTLVAQLDHHQGAGATAAVLNCNNQVVASGNEAGQVLLTLPHEAGRAPLFSFTAMAGREVAALSFDGTSRYIACAGDHPNVFVWDLKKKKQVRELKGHAGGAFVLAKEVWLHILSFCSRRHFCVEN